MTCQLYNEKKKTSETRLEECQGLNCASTPTFIC